MHPLREIRLRCVPGLRRAAAALLVAAAASACAPPPAAAPTPTPPPRDERVRRAAALVDLLLRRELTGAAAYLRANAAPGSMAAAIPERQVESFRTLLASGGLQLTGITPEESDLVAQLRGNGGRLLGIRMAIEAAAPHRFREVWPTWGDAPPESAGAPVLPAGHPAAARAAELVAALNAGDGAIRRIAAAGWTLRGAETVDTIANELAELRYRVGTALTLSRLTPAGPGEVDVEVTNTRGRPSVITLAVDSAAPHRMRVTGLGLQPEREARHHELVPGRVELATPVVTVPLEFANGRPLVDVMIEGKGPFRMLLETGCWCIDLSPRVIMVLGGGGRALTDDKLYRAGGGFVDHLHRVRELRIGGARLAGLVVTANPSYPGVDGILGLPAFKGLLMTVDYPNRRLRLERGALPPPDGTTILPLRHIFGDFVGIDVEVPGGTLPSVIDTQSGFGLSVSPKLAEGLQFERAPASTGEVLMGGRVTAPLKTGRLSGPFTIGGFVFQRQLAQVIAHPPNRPRLANLGSDVLRHFAVTLDQRNMRVRFARPDTAPIAPPPPFRSFGLAATAQRDGTVRITRVDAGGAAEKAGLKVADVVTRVGGTPAGELRPNGVSVQATLTRLAQGGDPVVFEVMRDGQEVRVTLASEIVVP